MQPKETVTLEDGVVHVKRSHNIENMIQGIKEYSEVIGKKHSKIAGAQYLGSIDTITADIWAVECGAGVGTKEFAAYAKKKLMDPDYRKFKASF